MRGFLPTAELKSFGGRLGFFSPERAGEAAGDVGSANWMASAARAAAVGEGVFVDIGSSTTDILALERGRAAPRGFTDRERLGCEELVYTGVVRIPVVSLAARVPFQGEGLGLMAEHFATAADVHRLTGYLPEHADPLPAADGGGAIRADSARRLAHVLGADREDAALDAWRAVAAAYLTECQLQRIHRACERHLSRGGLSPEALLIGAGVGRFLVRDPAVRTGRAYWDFGGLFGLSASLYGAEAADCAPALSVGALAQEGLTCTRL